MLVPEAPQTENGTVTTSLPDDDARGAGAAPDGLDPVILVVQIAESLPTLDADGLERLATALDELTEAVGLRMAVGEDQ